jgi:hypothetical protein
MQRRTVTAVNRFLVFARANALFEIDVAAAAAACKPL